jgi:hypothetical protein
VNRVRGALTVARPYVAPRGREEDKASRMGPVCGMGTQDSNAPGFLSPPGSTITPFGAPDASSLGAVVRRGSSLR